MPKEIKNINREQRSAWNFSPKRRLSPDRENSPDRVNLQSVKHEKLSPGLERFF